LGNKWVAPKVATMVEWTVEKMEYVLVGVKVVNLVEMTAGQ
jgi:hypothetical protein